MTPFVEGTIQMMDCMFGLSCQVLERTDSDEIEGTVFGMVPLGGEPNGCVTLSLGREDSRRLVAAMLQLPYEEVDDELIRDGVGEMANVVAGFAQTQVDPAVSGVEIGLPEVCVEAPSHSDTAEHCAVASDLGAVNLTFDVLRALMTAQGGQPR